MLLNHLNTYGLKDKMKIQYPIFLQCIEFATDSFWRSIFEDLAYGVKPAGVSLDGIGIHIFVDKLHFNFKFSETSPKELFDQITNLFYKKLNISPKSDKVRQQYNFYRLLQNTKYTDWSSIRKKNIKIILIKNYVIEKKEKYNLTVKQMKKLLSLITIGFNFKLITVDDIDYDPINNRIQSINGIVISDKQITLNKSFKIEPLLPQSLSTSNNTIVMKSLWEKYVSSLGP
jgi:hypothetical protein